MNIALIRQRYTPFGGAERFVARVLETLSHQGATLTVITRRWEASGASPILMCNPFYLGSLWRDASFARCVCRLLARHRFDLVQSHERIACCDVYRAGDGVHRVWLQQRRRILGPLRRLALSLNPYHRYTLAAEQRLFASSRLQAVICNSQMVKKEIRECFAVAEDKLHVIYSGVDTESFHPQLRGLHREAVRHQYGIPDEATLFLFVGSGFERKGLAATVEALARLPRDAHLMVVGKDRKLDQFRRAAKRLGLSQRVHFAGGQTQVTSYYGAGDVFVLPTLYDPFPNAALEAMASGLPVITSTKSGAAEFIEPGKNGFVVDALDTAGLAHAMEALMDSRTRQRASQAARAAIEPYTLDAMNTRLLDLYRSLLENRSGMNR